VAYLTTMRRVVPCFCGAKGWKRICFLEIHLAESILCKRISARTFSVKNKFFDGLKPAAPYGAEGYFYSEVKL